MTSATPHERHHWPRKIVTSGSRDWTELQPIRWLLELLNPKWLAHGGCHGADQIAARVANELGMVVRCYPADWEHLGKRAGPIRNRSMLDYGRPDLVLAFLLPQSRGTRDLLEAARERNIPTLTYEPNDS